MASRESGLKSAHQGRFGEAYFRALAAAAGLLVTKDEDDATGVDFHIQMPTAIRGTRFPMIQAQIKSWSTQSRKKNGTWRFRGLTERQFNNLAGTFQIPRYLIVVRVPVSADAYACVSSDALSLSHACYWVSLQDQEPIKNPRASVKVDIELPVQNVLTVERLCKLFDSDAIGLARVHSASGGSHE